MTDIHTWIGTTEVQNTLTAGTVSIDRTYDPARANVGFTGKVAGGTSKLVQRFLAGGTLSFRVNGGDPNVITFAQSADEAKSTYPDLDAPALVGRSTVSATEYQDTTWRPAINWGGSTSMGSWISLGGDIPDGMRWDGSQLVGVPKAHGTFSFTLTVSGSTGESEKTYSLVVSPSIAVSQVLVGAVGLGQDDQGNTTSMWVDGTGYFSPDNPQFAITLPVSADYAAASRELVGLVSDVQIVDPDGNALPITGDFSIDIWPRWNDTDALEVWTDNLAVTAGTSDVGTLLSAGGFIRFRFNGGDVNTIALSAPQP